jgi:hypothetical protein
VGARRDSEPARVGTMFTVGLASIAAKKVSVLRLRADGVGARRATIAVYVHVDLVPKPSASS